MNDSVMGKKGKLDRGSWAVIAACSAGFSLANLHRISPGVFAAELMKEFGASASVMGLLSSSYFYTYAALQIPVGMLCDRFAPGAVIGVFMTVGAAGSFIFAASGNLLTAIIGRIVLPLAYPLSSFLQFAYSGIQ